MTLQTMHTQLGAYAGRSVPATRRDKTQGDFALTILIVIACCSAPLNFLSMTSELEIIARPHFSQAIAAWRLAIAPLHILTIENFGPRIFSLTLHLLVAAALALPALIRLTSVAASLGQSKTALRSALIAALSDAVPQKYKDRVGFNQPPRAIVDGLFAGGGPTIARIKIIEKRFDRSKQNSKYYRNYGAPTRSPRTARALAACRAVRKDLAMLYRAVWLLLFVAALPAASLALFFFNALLLHWIPNVMLAGIA